MLDKDEMEWPPKERGVSVHAHLSLVFTKVFVIKSLAVWLVWWGRGK